MYPRVCRRNFLFCFRKLDESRNVQGLVTPHRYPNGTRSTSPRFPGKAYVTGSPCALESALNDLDSSDSYSSNSYVSAVGSQEDFTLVDLHMQVNRLIVDSPMLMSSYVSHLNQVIPRIKTKQYRILTNYDFV